MFLRDVSSGPITWPTRVTAGLSQVRTLAILCTLRYPESQRPLLDRGTVDDLTRNSAETGLDGHEAVRPPLLDQLMAISRASALEEMASGIAHELNQPLGAITTFAQAGERLLARPDASLASAREVFQLISKEALGAAEGIRRMRRLFQRENFSRTRCAIEDVVHELTPAIELLATEADIKLIVQTSFDLPLVSIDRLRIQHVLYTLVQNALDATLQGPSHAPRLVRIEVGGDRYGVEIAVIDAGCGIRSEQRAQVFHPFFTTKPAGTGLGLASARAIVQAHEGTIGFDPIEAGGTRFWFRLPAAEATT
jgi:signal transduction histidine kinase